MVLYFSGATASNVVLIMACSSVRFSRGTYETRMSDTLHLLVKNMIDGAE